MEGLEAILQMEMGAAITYIKVIFVVTFGKKREKLFFLKWIISGCVIACSRYIKKSNRWCFCNLFQTIYKPKLKKKNSHIPTNLCTTAYFIRKVLYEYKLVFEIYKPNQNVWKLHIWVYYLTLITLKLCIPSSHKLRLWVFDDGDGERVLEMSSAANRGSLLGLDLNRSWPAE